MDKPTASLEIMHRTPRMDSYVLRDERGTMIWCTRAYHTPEGRDGARERLRAWLRVHPHRVVLEAEHGEQAA